MTYEERWEAFKVFHNDNPDIAARLACMAIQMIEVGVTNWPIRNLWEVMKFRLRKEGKRDLSMDDEFAPFYARLIMQRHPNQLRGLFTLRGDIPEHLPLEQLA